MISSNTLYMKTGKRNLNYKLDFKKYRQCSFHNMFAFIFKYVKIPSLTVLKVKKPLKPSVLLAFRAFVFRFET